MEQKLIASGSRRKIRQSNDAVDAGNEMTDTELHPILTHYIAWIKSHERILIIGLAAWLAWHIYGNGLSAWIEHDKRNAAIAQYKVQTDSTANQQLTQQVADLKQQLATLSTQAQARQQERVVYVQQQKQKNDAAPPTEIAQTTASLLKLDQKEITVVDDKLLFSNAASHINVNALVDLSAAQAQLKDTQAVAQACQNTLVGEYKLEGGLRTELADEKKSHQDDIKTLKGEKQNAFMKGLKWGAAIGGAVVAILIKK